MSSCRLVRVFCKKETNQKVETLRKELELKEKELTIKNSRLNTLLQDPISVIKLLATNYYNLRRSIEGGSIIGNRRAIGTRQLTGKAIEAFKEKLSELIDIQLSDLELTEDQLEKLKEEVLKEGQLFEIIYNQLTEDQLEKLNEEGLSEIIKEKLSEIIYNQLTEDQLEKLNEFLVEEYNINVNECYNINVSSSGDLETLFLFIECCVNTYNDKNTFEFTTTDENATLTASIVNSILTKDDRLVRYSVSIKGYKTIGDYAFFNCYNLRKLTIPDSVTSIGEFAFYYCFRLTELAIPDSVKTIGDNAFTGCTALKKISIGNSVTSDSIGENAFFYCNALTEVIISDATAKQLNPKWSSPSTVSSFYGSPYPVKLTLPSE